MKKVEAVKTLNPHDVRPGMLIRVHQKIKEMNAKGEEKERIQVYEGLVIKHRGGKERGATMTVRKISEGIGVEKIFPLDSPGIAKIELVSQYDVRRSKLYFVRHDATKMKDMTTARPEKVKKAPVEKTPAKEAAKA
jgi:large subunit ribosomal protein L19